MLDTFKTASPEALAAIAEEKKVRRTDELFLLFAMGSQFDHLIYQSLAKLGVYCLVADPAQVTVDDVKALAPTGIITSGGPASMHAEQPPFDRRILQLGIPVLGICLGSQMNAEHIGEAVASLGHGEFGVHKIDVLSQTPLLAGIETGFSALQSHSDEITTANTITVHSRSSNGKIAVFSHQHLYGVQFHPEVSDTPDGLRMFENFCFKICSAKDRFPAADVVKQKIAKLRKQIGNSIVLLALSGGTDSSCAAHLLREATSGKKQLHGVYMKGIDRPDDEAFVMEHFANKDWITLHIIDATTGFLTALAGKVSMRDKRVAMRGVYGPTLERVADEVAPDGRVFIVQGTLYTDISESGGGHQSGARKAQIKLHHNVNLNLKHPEITPFDDCVKDGVRVIGQQLGVPEALLFRHPFPGPGLVVRIEGEITAEKLAMARALDGIYIEELRKWGLYDKVWQAGAVVTQSVHTYSKGDDAGSGPVIAYWAVWSVNGFTAQAAELPMEFHRVVAQRFGNEVSGVGAVVYRVSDKPFSTIEWG